MTRTAHDGPEPPFSREEQRAFWNTWNATVREVRSPDPDSLARGAFALAALQTLALPPTSRILEVGCGTAWLTAELVRYGTVTAIDLADEVVERARGRVPAASFLGGDFFDVDLPDTPFDAIVTLETLSHVADQAAFFARAARLLRLGGTLILTTQNRFVMERIDAMRQEVGQLRHWLTRRAVRRLARRWFRIRTLSTILPVRGRGVLRVAHSTKLTIVGTALLGAPRVRALQEWAGLGQTIVLTATRRG